MQNSSVELGVLFYLIKNFSDKNDAFKSLKLLESQLDKDIHPELLSEVEKYKIKKFSKKIIEEMLANDLDNVLDYILVFSNDVYNNAIKNKNEVKIIQLKQFLSKIQQMLLAKSIDPNNDRKDKFFNAQKKIEDFKRNL